MHHALQPAARLQLLRHVRSLSRAVLLLPVLVLPTRVAAVVPRRRRLLRRASRLRCALGRVAPGVQVREPGGHVHGQLQHL